MKTKEEIDACGNDEITLGDCFFGEPASEEDMRMYHDALSDIIDISRSEPSITMRTKRLLNEVLEMEFDARQWFILTLIIVTHIDAAEKRGAKKFAEAMELVLNRE